MEFILSKYEKIKLIIIVLLVASLPFYLFLSSILIMAGALISVINLHSFRDFNVKKLDLLSIVLIFYFLLELIGMTYTESENINIGMFNLQKHLGSERCLQAQQLLEQNNRMEFCAMLLDHYDRAYEFSFAKRK